MDLLLKLASGMGTPKIEDEFQTEVRESSKKVKKQIQVWTQIFNCSMFLHNWSSYICQETSRKNRVSEPNLYWRGNSKVL